MCAAVPSVTVISGCAIATVDPLGTEYSTGHLVVEGSRIVAVGAGPADPSWRERADRWVDGTGMLATPGLVNTHHHLYQWITRGYAQDGTLFEWLTVAVSGLGGHRRGDRRGVRVGEPGLDGAVRHHPDHRSPLRLPAGRR